MAAFTHTLAQMLVLFCLMLAGFVARRLSLTNDEFDTRISKIVMSITMPALILDSVLGSEELPEPAAIGEMFALSLLAYIFLILLAELLLRVLYRGCDVRERGVHAFAIVFGNVGFMGFPVVGALLGQEAVLYAAILNLPMTVCVFTWGVWSLRRGGGLGQVAGPGDGAGSTDSTSTDSTDSASTDSADSVDAASLGSRVLGVLKSIVNPCVVTGIVASALALAGITDNDGVIGSVCATLGQFTTPASLMVIGSSLGKMQLMSVINKARPYLTAALRLVAMPLAVWAFFGLFVGEGVMLSTVALCISMPVASLGTMLTLVNGGDTDAMVRVTSISTLLSLVTIPVVALIVV